MFLRRTASKIQLLELVIATSPEQQPSLLSSSSLGHFMVKTEIASALSRISTAFPPAILTSLLRVSLYSSILHFRDSTFQLKHARSLILLNRELPASPLLRRDLHLNGGGKRSLLRKGWWGEDNLLASILFSNHVNPAAQLLQPTELQ